MKVMSIIEEGETKGSSFCNITAPHLQAHETIEKSKDSNDVFVELLKYIATKKTCEQLAKT